MKNKFATRKDIDDFYAQKRMAVVGLSRDEKEYSRLVFADLRKRGYDLVPVNPNATEIDGLRCYARLSEVQPVPDAALVLLQEGSAAQVVRECAAAGIKRVWLRYHVDGAEEMCRQAGIKLVSGYCPFMFMPGTHWAHQFHAWGLQLIGQYPSA